MLTVYLSNAIFKKYTPKPLVFLVFDVDSEFGNRLGVSKKGRSSDVWKNRWTEVYDQLNFT